MGSLAQTRIGPEVYDGHTFDSLDDGVAYAKNVGFGNLLEGGVRAADELPSEATEGVAARRPVPRDDPARSRWRVAGFSAVTRRRAERTRR